MDAALENYCDRFAAGAGSNYTWCLEEGALVAKMPPPQPSYGEGDDFLLLCPVSAQATLELGTVLYAGDYLQAGRILPLKFGVLWCVVQASENTFSPRDLGLAQLRARLLRICGVEEEEGE